MRATLPLLFTLCVSLVSACDGDDPAAAAEGGAERAVAKAKSKGVFVPSEMSKIKRGGFVSEPCLLWNQPDIRREQRRPTRTGGRRDRTNDRRAVSSAEIQELDFETTPKDIAPLLLAQLRFTAQQFEVVDGDVFKLKPAKLFEETEGPLFSEILDKKSSRLYTRINIAAGDNPMDVIYEHGSLRPVAVVEDDSVTFCADELKGQRRNAASPPAIPIIPS